MDNSSNQVIGADAGGGAQFHKFNLKDDYARCDFDVTHAANVSMVYEFPRVRSLSGAAGRVVNGWSFNMIVGARSGQPFNVLSGRDNSLTGAPNNDLADQTAPSATRPAGVDKVQQWFNTSVFAVNKIGTFGNTQRNTLNGPGFVGFDVGVSKTTRLTERAGLQFRFEGFNLFNHPNFNNPVGTVTNVNFGKITSALDPRVLQFALRLTF